MQPAGRLIYEWVKEAFYSFTELATFNLLWFGLTVLVVTAPPAAGGLFYATNRLAHGERVDWRVFFEGFRKHFWLSWRWGLVNMAVFGILSVNIWFYGRVDQAWGPWVQGLALGILILWSLLQLYMFPLLFEQNEPRVVQALRNSLVLYMRRPGMAIGLGLFIAVLAGISITLVQPAWLILTAGLCAFLLNHGVIYMVGTLTSEAKAKG